MLWAALLPTPCPPRSSGSTSPLDDPLQAVATWALQFTPKVARLEDAVVMEVEASVRLFGGKRALRDRVLAQSPDLGVTAVAWAPNSLAALAFARAGRENGVRGVLSALLDRLPMDVLSALRPHLTTLNQLGCRTLGEVRALPRAGISRRFGMPVLVALDQAYGLRPETHVWVDLPASFKSRVELMSRVDNAPAMLFGARRLLVQLCGWLAARQAGITAFTLRWMHDAMRPRDVGQGDELTIRTAAPMRDIEHLCRLLAEHLARIELQAPVGDLEIEAVDVQSLAPPSGSLLPDTVSEGESMTLVLERIAARLGESRVLRPVIVEDHRLEWLQHWQPAPTPLPNRRVRTDRLPQPTFVLPEPLRLAVRGNRPIYQGPLQLLVGPHRIEGGWWHRVTEGDEQSTRNVARDYWIALGAHCGVLWIFQQRLAHDETAWYLHGAFA